MQLFSRAGRLADQLLEEYWQRIKERRAYLTFSAALLVMFFNELPSKHPVYMMLSFFTLWILYVILGPHGEKTT
jgi:hypothetical protein